VINVIGLVGNKNSIRSHAIAIVTSIQKVKVITGSDVITGRYIMTKSDVIQLPDVT
jgi:hypothetical protein